MTRRIEEFLDRLETVPDADPYVGPDQAAIEAMFASMVPEPELTGAASPS